MRELPTGWESKKLHQITDLTSGTGFPEKFQCKKNLNYPFFKVGNLREVSSRELLVTSGNTVDESIIKEIKARIIPANSIIFAKIGMAIRLNRRRIVGVPCCIDNNLIAVLPNDAINNKFLLRFLETIDFMPFTQATTVPSLRIDNIKNIEIPIPPLPEQQRIVAKLEKLLARVDACKERLEKIPSLLKRFRQSVLAAACSGKLTEEWRERHPEVEGADRIINSLKELHRQAGSNLGGKAAEPTEGVHNLTKDCIPETWTISELKWLCETNKPITYGILKPGPDIKDGIPYIRVVDFPNDIIINENIRRTSPDIAFNYRRSMLQSDDILLSIRGTVGRVCRVPSWLDKANITQDTARIAIRDSIMSKYIEIYLRCPSCQKRFEKATKGVAIRGINIGDVRALQVCLPPLPEQHEIVRRVEALFVIADQIEMRYNKAKKYIDKLSQSILAKAFRGELVPQDPDDEPASVLLERINTQQTFKKRKDKHNKINRLIKPVEFK